MTHADEPRHRKLRHAPGATGEIGELIGICEVGGTFRGFTVCTPG